MSERESAKSPDEEAAAERADDDASEPAGTDGAASDADADAGAADGASKRRSRRRPAARTQDADAPADEEEEKKPPPPRPNYLFLVISSLVFLVADLWSKEWAVKRLSCVPPTPDAPPCEPGWACDVAQNPPVCVMSVVRPEQHIVVIENYFHFDLAKNKGGAWGILGNQPDYVRLPFFFLISAIAVVFIVSLYRKLEPRQVALKWALPLVLGGALGNLVDRVRHQHVIDFIDWFMGDSHWPTFNIADVWIVAGVILMVADMFTPKRPVRKRKAVAVVDKDAALPSERAEGA